MTGRTSIEAAALLEPPPLARSLLLAILTVAVMPLAARSAEPGIETLGSVRGDTLFVTLDKVRAAALAHNEMLAAGGAAAEAAKARATGAWQGLLPQVELDEFHLRSDDPLNAFAYKLNKRSVTAADFDPGLLDHPPIAVNDVSRVQVRQPLFNGGMGLYGKRAADAMAEAATCDSRRAGETVTMQAVETYAGLVLAESYARVVRNAIAAAEAHLAQARSRVDAQMATEADLLQARVHLSGLRQRLIEVRNMAAAAGQHILLLTAVTTDLPLAAKSGFVEPAAPDSSATPAPPEPGVAIASRADVLADRHRAEAAGDMLGVARGGLLPHLNLSLERDWYSDHLFGGDATSWTLGVYATWNVFAGLGDIGRVRAARAEKRAAESAYAFSLRRARAELTQARLDLQAAFEKVAVARQAVAAGREGARIVSAQYGEGLASMTDLLDTQAAATAAEGSLVQALHDYNVGLARLRYASGASGAQED